MLFRSSLDEIPKFGNQKKDGTPRRRRKRRTTSEALITNDYELKQAVEHIRELEEVIALRSSPKEAERVAENRRRYQRERYARKVQSERKRLLPPDRKCILCDVEQHTSKQWVMCDFIDGKHAICMSCFTKLRLEVFNGDAKLLRAYLKTINYNDVGKVKSGSC